MRTRLAVAIPAIIFLAISSHSLVRAQQEQPVDDNDVQVLTFQDLAYPPLARNARVQGTVVVRVTLDDEGKVTEATAISGHPLFTGSAVQNATSWTFRPNSSKSAVIVYNFTILPGVCGARAGSLFVLQGKNLATVVTCPPVPMP